MRGRTYLLTRPFVGVMKENQITIRTGRKLIVQRPFYSSLSSSIPCFKANKSRTWKTRGRFFYFFVLVIAIDGFFAAL